MIIKLLDKRDGTYFLHSFLMLKIGATMMTRPTATPMMIATRRNIMKAARRTHTFIAFRGQACCCRESDTVAWLLKDSSF